MLKPIEWVVKASEKPLSVVIYQPNVPQEHKWDRDWYQPILRQLRSASEPHYGADHSVWPEAAIPNFYQRRQRFPRPDCERAAAIRDHRVYRRALPGRTGRRLLQQRARPGPGPGVYHKQHLVPFGEYVPLEGLLRGLIAFFDLPMSHSAPGRRTSRRCAPVLPGGALRLL